MAKEERIAREGRIAEAEDAFKRAQSAWEKDDYPLAMQYAEKAVELMPDEGRYLNFAGFNANVSGEYKKAINHYEKALSIYLSEVSTIRANLRFAYAEGLITAKDDETG